MSQQAIICPSCQQLINKTAKRCPNCGWENNSWGKFSLLVSSKDIGKLLIGINLFFYLLTLVLSFIYTEGFRLFTPEASILQIVGWAAPNEVFHTNHWKILSSVFLHGGFFHVAFNMALLYQMYPQNEALIGRLPTFVVYILSGIGGSLAACTFGSNPVVGASGAIFGLMGSFIAVGRESGNIMLRLFSKRYVSFVVILLIIGFLMPGVSNLSHIGGGLTGFVLGWLLVRNQLPQWFQSLLGILCIMATGITFLFMLWQVVSILFI